MKKSTLIVREALLSASPVDTIADLSHRELMRALRMLVLDDEMLVRQRACYELGRIVSEMPAERVSNYLRRMLWKLSPESGDYPVGTPELFGEIGHRAPEQAKDFVGAYLFYLDDETLLPGLLQAIGRIGQVCPKPLRPYIDMLSEYLTWENSVVAGNAALALYRIGGDAAEWAREALVDDEREINLFCDGKFQKIKLRELSERGEEIIESLSFVTNPDQG